MSLSNLFGLGCVLASFLAPWPAQAPRPPGPIFVNEYANAEALGCREVLGVCYSHKRMGKVRLLK